jgi:hypothetical protein
MYVTTKSKINSLEEREHSVVICGIRIIKINGILVPRMLFNCGML